MVARRWLHTLSVVALAALALAPPPAAATEIPPHPRLLRFPDFAFRLPSPSQHRIDLPGGDVVYLIEDRSLPLVDVALALRVGNYLDPPDRAGLAALTGAMLRRGGAGDLPPDAFDERADFLGAHLSSSIGELRGGLSLSVPSWALDDGLELLAGALLAPLFDAGRFEDLRANVLEGLARRNEEPLDILEREWLWLLFGEEHVSTRPPTPASIEALGREDFAAFHRRHVVPARWIVAASGDVDRAGLVDRLTALRVSNPPGEPAPAWPPAPSRHSPRPGLYAVDLDIPQAKILMGHRAAVPRSPRERAALAVMAEILGGGGAISRIAGRLRTAEGLVYRASATIDAGRPWPRDTRVFFETASANVPRAVRLALEEIDRLRQEPVHPRELAVVKQSLASSLRLAFDTAEKAAGYLAEDVLLGRPHTHWEVQYRLIGEVGVDDVLEAARRFLRPDEMVVLLVGDADEASGRSIDGVSELERAAGRAMIRLPARDPRTLRPLPPG